MKFPKFAVRLPMMVIAVPLVCAGLLVPAVGSPLDAPASGVIGMDHDGFVVNGVSNDDEDAGTVPVITIHVGETLSFQNNSRWIHIVGPGQDGLLAAPSMGAMTPREMMEENAAYTTPPWNTAGTYLITCTVHPDMNAKVVVLP